MQAPISQFPGYVKSMVTELHTPLCATVNGNLTGKGTLDTVLLCETLISYLPSGMYQDQPTMLLRAYDVVPLTVLSCSRRIDLHHFAKVKSGVLYIPRPTIEKVRVPLGSLSSSAHATARQMLEFLGQLKSDRSHQLVLARAAENIVTHFCHELVEMHIVRGMEDFKQVKDDCCVSDMLRVEEYAASLSS